MTPEMLSELIERMISLGMQEESFVMLTELRTYATSLPDKDPTFFPLFESRMQEEPATTLLHEPFAEVEKKSEFMLSMQVLALAANAQNHAALQHLAELLENVEFAQYVLNQFLEEKNRLGREAIAEVLANTGDLKDQLRQFIEAAYFLTTQIPIKPYDLGFVIATMLTPLNSKVEELSTTRLLEKFAQNKGEKTKAQSNFFLALRSLSITLREIHTLREPFRYKDVYWSDCYEKMLIHGYGYLYRIALIMRDLELGDPLPQLLLIAKFPSKQVVGQRRVFINGPQFSEYIAHVAKVFSQDTISSENLLWLFFWVQALDEGSWVSRHLMHPYQRLLGVKQTLEALNLRKASDPDKFVLELFTVDDGGYSHELAGTTVKKQYTALDSIQEELTSVLDFSHDQNYLDLVRKMQQTAQIYRIDLSHLSD